MATFKNHYYRRTAASAKACYICYRPTTTVLATINTVDFIYTCDGHLTDRGFATLIEPSDGSSTHEQKKVSDEEIRRVKEEWEERQRQREEKGKQEKEKQEKDKQEKEKQEKEKSKQNDKDGTKESDKSPVPSKAPPPTPIPVPGSSAAKPTHQQYTLHRDIWGMRLAEHKKRRQTIAAKEVAPRLPATPRSEV